MEQPTFLGHVYYKTRTGDLEYTAAVLEWIKKNKGRWLLDLIVSYQENPEIQAMPVQQWELHVSQGSAILICTDDFATRNIVEHHIPYTDHPEPERILIVEDKVICFPAERPYDA